MTTVEIKQKGVLFCRENGCELYLVIGKWNDMMRKADHYWYMISEKTGVHMIRNQSNRPCERVNAHWNGFLINQNN
jgi:CDP-diacylglycerol pyrophosphatase